MPELPEVETIRQDLIVKIIGRKIKSTEVLARKSIRNSKPFFQKNLVNKTFLDIQRRGKLLIFVLNNGLFLLIHLRMTGQLIYLDKQGALAGGHILKLGSFREAVGGELPNRYTRVIISFNNTSHLFFNDLRRFGYLKIVNSQELEKILNNNYGIEPLTPEFCWGNFQKIFESRHTNVKALLLNQRIIAGLGNIYTDESLFLAGLRPTRRADSLSTLEKKTLFKSIKTIIKKAINNRGTTFQNYTDTAGRKGNFSRLLKVYGRKDQPCLNCGELIEKIKLAGRGTHYCPHCQK